MLLVGILLVVLDVSIDTHLRFLAPQTDSVLARLGGEQCEQIQP